MIDWFGCRKYQEKVKMLEFDNAILSNTIKGLVKERDGYKVLSDQLKNQVKMYEDVNLDLKVYVEELKMRLENYENKQKENSEIDYYIDYYYNKYRETNITYKGMDVNGKPMFYDVKYFCLAGQNDYRLKEWVKNNIKVDAGLPKWVQYDDIVYQVQNKVSVNYQQDVYNLKQSEYWLTASETFYFNAGDCEDWTHLKYVLARIAGVPAGLLRVVCGSTSLGGHSTLYYLSSNKKWLHVEATSKEIYEKGNPNDALDIQSVWFSFNEEKAFSEMAVDAYEKSKDSINLKFNVNPLNLYV